MKCPNCGNRDIDVKYGDGYSPDTRDCSKCGMMWTYSMKEGKVVIMKEGKQILYG